MPSPATNIRRRIPVFSANNPHTCSTSFIEQHPSNGSSTALSALSETAEIGEMEMDEFDLQCDATALRLSNVYDNVSGDDDDA